MLDQVKQILEKKTLSNEDLKVLENYEPNNDKKLKVAKARLRLAKAKLKLLAA